MENLLSISSKRDNIWMQYFPWSCIYLLTPWSRVLLEKVTSSHLVKILTTFYRTQKFITIFTSAPYLSQPWASLIQSMPPHPTTWRSILILSSRLCLGLTSGLFPSGFPSKTLNTLYSPPYEQPHAPPISFFSILSPEQYLMWSTDHYTPPYVVFCTPLLPCPS